MTNGERIRSQLTDEKLAELLADNFPTMVKLLGFDTIGFDCAVKEATEGCNPYGCNDCMLEWLKTECDD